MNALKIIVVSFLLLTLSACGVGEFLVKRTVNKFERDAANDLKSYADFDSQQEQQLEQIASELNRWLRLNRLPVVTAQLELIASDIETHSQIQNTTWSSVVDLLSRPVNLSEQEGLVTDIATLVHDLSREQAEDVVAKFTKEHNKRLAEDRKLSVEKQNKKVVRTLKILFSELGISRSRAQLKQAREIVAQRYDRSRDIELQAQESHRIFVALILNRSINLKDYVSDFSNAWRVAEAGSKHRSPDTWEHNVQITQDVLNYLLADLSAEQRARAASKIRVYADIFSDLSDVE